MSVSLLFQSLLVQVSFKTMAARYDRTEECVSIPSRSGLLQNAIAGELPGGFRFNPFSFRSPSKLLPHKLWPLALFQSLLVQVSFKTITGANIRGDTRFNPFSFRSPSKQGNDVGPDALRVSIPSRSGLLQNRLSVCSLRPQRRFNPFSFRSPSKHSRPGECPGLHRFNPFSFRSPSKPASFQNLPGRRWFQSLLVQVSFKTRKGKCLNVCSFQSLLVQVSFKTMSASAHVPSTRFNPFSFRSPSKHFPRSNYGPWKAFQSLLVQVSFKTRAIQRMRVFIPGFNPFSFRSPSKRSAAASRKQLLFQSLLVQVSFKTD